MSLFNITNLIVIEYKTFTVQIDDRTECKLILNLRPVKNNNNTQKAMELIFTTATSGRLAENLKMCTFIKICQQDAETKKSKVNVKKEGCKF